MAEKQDEREEDYEFAYKVHLGNRSSDSESSQNEEEDDEFFAQFAPPPIEISDDNLEIISLPNAWIDKKTKNEQSHLDNHNHHAVADCFNYNQNGKTSNFEVSRSQHFNGAETPSTSAPQPSTSAFQTHSTAFPNYDSNDQNINLPEVHFADDSQSGFVEQNKRSRKRGKNKNNTKNDPSMNENNQKSNGNINTNTYVLNTSRSKGMINRNTDSSDNNSSEIQEYFSREVQLFFEIFKTVPQLATKHSTKRSSRNLRRKDSVSSLSTASSSSVFNINENEFPCGSTSSKPKAAVPTTAAESTSHFSINNRYSPNPPPFIQSNTNVNEIQNVPQSATETSRKRSSRNLRKKDSVSSVPTCSSSSVFKLNENEFPCLSASLKPKAAVATTTAASTSHFSVHNRYSPSPPPFIQSNTDVNEIQNVAEHDDTLFNDETVIQNQVPNNTKRRKSFKPLNENETGFIYTTEKGRLLQSEKGLHKNKKTTNGHVTLTSNNVISLKKGKNKKSNNKRKQSDQAKINETITKESCESLKMYDGVSQTSIKPNDEQLVETNNTTLENSNTKEVESDQFVNIISVVNENDVHGDINNKKHLQTKLNKALNNMDNVSTTHTVDDIEQVKVNESMQPTNDNVINNIVILSNCETEVPKSSETTATGNSIVRDKVNYVDFTFEIEKYSVLAQETFTAIDKEIGRDVQMSEVDNIKKTDESLYVKVASTSTVTDNSISTSTTANHSNLKLEEKNFSARKADNTRPRMDVVPYRMNCDNFSTREPSFTQYQNVTVEDDTNEETSNSAADSSMDNWYSVIVPSLENVMSEHLVTNMISIYVILIIAVSFLRWVIDNSLYFIILIILTVFNK